MKILSFFILLGSWSLFPLLTPPRAEFSIYVFLAEECIISQNYALTLRELHDDYAGDAFHFVGVFANPSSTHDKMTAFREAYQFPFAFQLDDRQTLKDRFGVQVTPEVVVVDNASGEVRYQGRIDDTYYRVGRRRTVTTTSELADALAALRAGREVPVPRTTTIGCFISPLHPLQKEAPRCQEATGQ